MTQHRTTDPVTSRLAAEAIEQSGAAQPQRETLEQAVRTYSGATAAELASMTVG